MPSIHTNLIVYFVIQDDDRCFGVTRNFQRRFQWQRSSANGTVHGYGVASAIRTWHPEVPHWYATVSSRKDASYANAQRAV